MMATTPDLEAPSWLARFEWVAERMGYRLYEWQRRWLHTATELDEEGLFKRAAAAVETTRQSGKSVVLEVFGVTGAVAGLNVAITAQEKGKAKEKFIEGVERWQKTSGPDMQGKLGLANGDERWSIPAGGQWRPLTCSAKSARSYTMDWTEMDEAAWLLRGQEFEEAASPTMLTRSHPLIAYVTSAGDKNDPAHRFFAGVRHAARMNPEGEIVWIDWECPPGLEDRWGEEELWRMLVPVLSEDTPMAAIVLRNLRREWDKAQRRGTEIAFAREYLNLWTEVPGAGELTAEAWASMARPPEKLGWSNRDVWLCLDVAPDRSHASIVGAEASGLGRARLRMFKDAPGTGWIAGYMRDLMASRQVNVVGLIYDDRAGSGAFLPHFKAAGAPLHKLEWREFAACYGRFMDICADRGIVHDGHPAFARAVDSAAPRVVLDTLAWDRQGPSPICPLVAATNAVSVAVAYY